MLVVAAIGAMVLVGVVTLVPGMLKSTSRGPAAVVPSAAIGSIGPTPLATSGPTPTGAAWHTLPMSGGALAGLDKLAWNTMYSKADGYVTFLSAMAKPTGDPQWQLVAVEYETGSLTSDPRVDPWVLNPYDGGASIKDSDGYHFNWCRAMECDEPDIPGPPGGGWLVAKVPYMSPHIWVYVVFGLQSAALPIY